MALHPGPRQPRFMPELVNLRESTARLAHSPFDLPAVSSGRASRPPSFQGLWPVAGQVAGFPEDEASGRQQMAQKCFQGHGGH